MRNVSVSIFAGAVLSLVAGGVAVAAPPFAPAYNWSGFYIGGNIGHGWSTIDADAMFTGIGTPSKFGPFAFAHSDALKFRGTVGGVQIGINWQPSSHWVYGLEADWQASGEKGSFSSIDSYDGTRLGFVASGTANTSYDARISWFGTVRGRIGYVWDRLLIYGTAGLAYGQVKLAGTMTDSGSTLVIAPPFTPVPFGATTGFSASRVNTGWAAGGGVEGALVSNWSWKAEYLYLDLGSLDLFAPGPFVSSTISAHARFIDNIVRVGVNHRFGG
jgi:outer membrane immunogenic protein